MYLSVLLTSLGVLTLSVGNYIFDIQAQGLGYVDMSFVDYNLGYVDTSFVVVTIIVCPDIGNRMFQLCMLLVVNIIQ